ncbi:hypothetical protein ACWGPC_55985, partial [Streptomyces mirabilis]
MRPGSRGQPLPRLRREAPYPGRSPGLAPSGSGPGFGARGVKGSDAVARKLDELADGIVTPVTVKRGLMARLHYLTRTEHSRRAARDAGLTETDRTRKA